MICGVLRSLRPFSVSRAHAATTSKSAGDPAARRPTHHFRQNRRPRKSPRKSLTWDNRALYSLLADRARIHVLVHFRGNPEVKRGMGV
jgi:hypothetical protein